MPRGWRWLAVVSGIAALAAMPSVVGALPVGGGERSAQDLLARVDRSRATPYAGYAESTGGLALPVSGQLASISELLGGRTQLRVWWRSVQDWRVDSVGLTGEQGVHRTGGELWTWDYEDNRARVTSDVGEDSVRLPRAADTLPSELGRRFLAEATADEVGSLPPRRVAGRDADGLRLRPADPNTSIDHVDVWADRETGIPLRVELFGVDATRPALSSTFTDFTADPPTAAQTAFTPPSSARVRSGSRFDLVDLVAQASGPQPPQTLLGMPRADRLASGGAIGVYGRGVTELVAAPMPGRQAGSLRRALAGAPGVAAVPPGAGAADGAAGTAGAAGATGVTGLSLAVGPLGMLLTAPDAFGRSWLLTGTVTVAALAAAQAELVKVTGGAP